MQEGRVELQPGPALPGTHPVRREGREERGVSGRQVWVVVWVVWVMWVEGRRGGGRRGLHHDRAGRGGGPGRSGRRPVRGVGGNLVGGNFDAIF